MNRFALASLTIPCLTLAAAGQCTSVWDGSLGLPGIDRGYIQPMMNWDDGTGERLYVGGSFNAVRGVPGSTILAQWDRDTNTWDRVGTPGLSTGSTNGFLTNIMPFEVLGEERLVVAGFFASAGGVADTRSIAAWNGTEWISMSAELPSPQSIWAMTTGDVGQGENLIIGGAWPEIGGTFGADLAQWDGDEWLPIGDGSGITGGFSPTVFAAQMFDDGTGPALYAGGRFDSIGFAPNTAVFGRFNGTEWEAVGGGLNPEDFLSSINAMAVFDDGTGEALYVGGSDVFAPGQPFSSVYKWDGVAWSAIGQEFGGRVTDLKVWDDGTGPALYVSGTAVPDIQYVAKLEGDEWVPLAGGAASQPATSGSFASVFGLHVWDGDLYVGGNFTLVGDPAIEARGIVRRTGCATPDCYADFDDDGRLSLFDFLAFQNAFDAGDTAADCDDDGRLSLFDFLCFQNAFDAGCD